MNKAWTYTIDIFIGILIMFMGVSIYFGIRTEAVMKSIYENASEEFINDVKKKGIITIEDYEGYMERMGRGGEIFNISYEHRYKILEPEYRFKTLEEILEEQNRAYQGSNDYHYREVETERPPVDDPINDGNLNTETNESILAKAVDTPPNPSHVHGDGCYHGTKHVHTGNPTSGGGCYGDYSHEECGETAYIDSRYGYEETYTCGAELGPHIYCTGTLTHIYADTKYKCSNGHQSSITIRNIYVCDYCGERSYSYSRNEPSSIECSSTHTIYKLNCYKTEGRYYDSNGNELGPICGQIVASIVSTNPEQTVYQNDSLITTARATYQDGSERTVLCTTSLSTASVGKDKIGVLTYTYVLNGSSYSKTCNIKVTIIPKNKVCPKGHVYNLNSDGSDPGCPYCRAWIESLRVTHPNTSPIVITIGTTLIDNGITLLATYMDGHTEVVTSGYIDNLDIGYLGTKQVTIGYMGASVTVLVTTKCATMICDICGYEYDLYPDGTNPGCPRCLQRIPVFTGNIMTYEHINHTEEILKELYDNGGYIFNVNDVFSVNVQNKSSNIARMLLRKAYPSLSNRWLNINKSEYIMTK